MDRAKNPFAPGAGSEPPELTGRSKVLADAMITLERVKSGRHDRSSLLIGLRGVGKTVLLNRIQRNAIDLGFETAFLEAPEGRPLAELLVPPLRSLLLRLDSAEGARQKLLVALRTLQAFASTFQVTMGNIGVQVVPPAGIADSGVLDHDLVDLMIAVGEAAEERAAAVAIFIDEIQYLEEHELSALISGLHRISQLNLPVVVFGAGLPQILGLSGNARTYAERLFRFETIGALDKKDAAKAIRDPILREGADIEPAALNAIIKATEGYPYFLQEWGSHAWNEAPASPITIRDVRTATKSAIAALDNGFFRVRFDRLTPAERDYVRAMSGLGDGPYKTGDIAAQLKRTADQVAPIRSRVIMKGMAYAASHGHTDFTVPMFADYMMRTMPELVAKAPRKRTSKKRKT